MALDYSIINSKPSFGFANFTYDVGSAITEYVRSAPIGSQVTVSVTDPVSSGTTVLQEGTDYYTGADGEIVIDRDLVPFGAIVSFSLNTDFENFYDDFSDLGPAPAGPVKRRTQQLQNMALQLRDRIETLESGDIEVNFTETTITAGNVTYGPGAFQIGTANGVQVSDIAGTGFQIGLNYGTIFADSLVTSQINGVVQSYLDANPPASGVVTVSGRAPDGVGNIDLLIADVSDAATVATSGDYNDLTGTPQDLSEFNNDQGFIGTTDVTDIFNAIDDKLDKSKLDGGLPGQVLKKLSDADGDYAWGTDNNSGGGGGGGGATILDDLDDVTIGTNVTNQVLLYDGSVYANSFLPATAVSGLETEIDDRITASNPFDGDYNSLSNTPTLRTDAEVRTLADEQIAASSPFDGDYGSLSNTPDLSGIATNAGNITTNTNAIAGKFDEPTGTPSTGDVIEWDGSQAAWAAPSGSSGGGIQFWQVDFGLIQEMDGSHSSQSPNLNGPELTNGSFGSYTVDGSTPTFTFSSTGIYKVTMSLGLFTTVSPARKNVDMDLNGTTVSRVGFTAEGVSGFSGTLDPGATVCSIKYLSIASSEVLTLSGDLTRGTWIIEKVG